ncbi:hypothetical protein [Yoonia sp. R2-816]|uniref:hypothetical protein n=1 Tax=Yoonia sp. R2-816 TaxID=3342638 RepID=UPI00372BA901
MSDTSLEPLFICTETFGPWLGQRWYDYIKYSGLTQLKELVSLDAALCGPILEEIKDEYWPHIVNEDFMLDYFKDLDFLLAQVSETKRKNTLCVFRNPPLHPVAPTDTLKFAFLGYDLVDLFGSASALSNCGGFSNAFSNTEINSYGLLDTYERALEVQAALRANYPDEDHADCHNWALFRAVEP